MDLVDGFARHGEAPALVFPGRPAISYAELARRVATVSGELGTEKRLVAVEAAPSEHAIVAYLAALAGGHTVALLPRGDAAAMDEFCQVMAPDVVCRRVDGRWRNTIGEGASGGLHAELALLLGTSGSTGKSRFVRISSTAIEANARSIAQFLGLKPDDRAALILPFHYSYGLSVVNSHLAAGASIYVADKGAGDATFAEEMRQAGCTNIPGVPYSFELMEKSGFRQARLPELRFMTVAGGRIDPTLAESFRRHLSASGKRLFLMYGQTEATARIAYVPPESLAGNLDSIGIAIPGGALRLLDEDGTPVEKTGEVGELAYRGPNVMMGYAECRADLARGHEIDELRTGDVAVRDVHDFYRIVGRKKRFSKIGGLRINHAAVEHALAAAGMTAAVAGDDRRLVAAIAPPSSKARAIDAIVAASGLTALHLELREMDALPRLASGKIDYAAVGRLLEPDEPRPNESVIDAFRRAFYPRPVGPSDSFESLGGDSLLYVQLSLTLERALGRLPDAWEGTPVGDLARVSRRASGWQAVDADILLRAAAILLVVVHHATLWPVPGGAATLVLLVGFGIARFQSSRLFAGRPGRMLAALVQNIALYFLIVAGFALARGEVPWASVFLVGNFGLADPALMLPYLYWFVEAYAQIVLIFAALFAWRPLRSRARSQPLRFGLAMLAATVMAKYAVPLVWNVGAVQIFTVPDVLYLAAFGWCAQFAATRRQRFLVLAVAILLFPLLAYTGGNWIGSWVKFSMQLAAVSLLLFLPKVPLPSAVVRAILPVSAASYHIYLFHRILPDLLLPQPDPATVNLVSSAVAIAGGIAVGLAVFALQKMLAAVLADRRIEAGRGSAPQGA